MPWVPPQYDNAGSALAKGATSALDNFVMPLEADRAKQRLDLQMQSAKLGQVAQSQMQLAKFKQGLESVPPDEYAALGKIATASANAIQSGEPMPEIDTTQFKSQPGQQAATGLIHGILTASADSMRINHPVPVTSTDATGNVSTTFVNPRTMQKMGPAIPKGLAPTVINAIQKSTTQYHTINSMADTLKTELIGDGTSQNPGVVNSDASMASRLAQGATLTMGDIMKSNSPAAKAFMDSLKSRTIMYQKEMSASGRPPSVPILDAESGRFFTPTDDIQTVVQKINMMKQDAYDLGSAPYISAHQAIPDDMVSPISEARKAQAQAAQQGDMHGAYLRLKQQQALAAQTQKRK